VSALRIVVCVKQVPDTWSEKRLDPADQTLDRATADGVIDELDTYAVEEALRI
jgi:electron transfer flavoprotein beta subunit